MEFGLSYGIPKSEEYHWNAMLMELREKLKEAKEICAGLGPDAGTKKDRLIERLESELDFVEQEKRKVEEEVRALKRRNEELEDEKDELSIENSVLMCEKIKANREIQFWKEKYWGKRSSDCCGSCRNPNPNPKRRKMREIGDEDGARSEVGDNFT